MKRIKLFEEHSKDYQVSNLFNNIISQIKGENNLLSNQVTLIDVEKSTVNDAIEKNIILNFEDPEYMYQVTLVVKPHNSPNISKKEYVGYVMAKIYDLETNEELVRDLWEVTLSDTEDGIKIKEMSESQVQSAQSQTQPVAQGQGQEIQGQIPPQESVNYRKYDKIFEAQEMESEESIEEFIINKISVLKEKLEKNKTSQDEYSVE